MATIDKEFADNLAKNNGFFNGDDNNDLGDNPRCIKIVKYTNAWGNDAYGAVFEGELAPNRYEEVTEYVRDPHLFWVYKPVTDTPVEIV